MMFKVDFDLSCLTVDELLAARARLHVGAVEVHAAPLAELFEALEYAVHSNYRDPLSDQEKHEIAQALTIDETTGEWLAGA